MQLKRGVDARLYLRSICIHAVFSHLPCSLTANYTLFSSTLHQDEDVSETSPALSGSVASGATVSPFGSLYLIQVKWLIGVDSGGQKGGGGIQGRAITCGATIRLYAYSSTSISSLLEQQPVKCKLSDRKDFYWSLDNQKQHSNSNVSCSLMIITVIILIERQQIK